MSGIGSAAYQKKSSRVNKDRKMFIEHSERVIS